MSEVKRYHRDDDEFERYECEFVVDAKDFDRVTAERDAALAELAQLRAGGQVSTGELERLEEFKRQVRENRRERY